MDSRRRIGVVTTITIFVSLADFSVSLFSAGVGHGSYLPFSIFFPYSFIATVLLGGGIGIVAWTLLLAQIPVYGVVLGRAWIRNGLRRQATLIIATHVLVATVCMVILFTT